MLRQLNRLKCLLPHPLLNLLWRQLPRHHPPRHRLPPRHLYPQNLHRLHLPRQPRRRGLRPSQYNGRCGLACNRPGPWANRLPLARCLLPVRRHGRLMAVPQIPCRRVRALMAVRQILLRRAKVPMAVRQILLPQVKAPMAVRSIPRTLAKAPMAVPRIPGKAPMAVRLAALRWAPGRWAPVHPAHKAVLAHPAPRAAGLAHPVPAWAKGPAAVGLAAPKRLN